jgi:predicted dehydrogenase
VEPLPTSHGSPARNRERGELGQVRKVIASLNMNLPKDPSHRLNNLALGGGALLDLGIYRVSFAFGVLGVAASVRASGSMSTSGVDRQTAVIFEYPAERSFGSGPALSALVARRSCPAMMGDQIDTERGRIGPPVGARRGIINERAGEPMKSAAVSRRGLLGPSP